MDTSNLDPQIIFGLISAACLFLGVLIGLSMTTSKTKKKIEEAVKSAKKEAEEEKLEISRDLNQQLVHVRDSIVKTVEAYSAVAKTIQEKLPTPPEFQSLNLQDNASLSLEFSQPTENKIESENNEIESDESHDDFFASELDDDLAVNSSYHSHEQENLEANDSDQDEEVSAPKKVQSI